MPTKRQVPVTQESLRKAVERKSQLTAENLRKEMRQEQLRRDRINERKAMNREAEEKKSEAERVRLITSKLESRLRKQAKRGESKLKVMVLLEGEFWVRPTAAEGNKDTEGLSGAAKKIVAWLNERGFKTHLEFDMNNDGTEVWYNLIATW